MYSGSSNSASKAPPPRNPSVSAAMMAPIRLNTGVPTASDNSSTPISAPLSPNCMPTSGAHSSNGKPVVTQCATIFPATIAPNGALPKSICSREPSAKSPANMRLSDKRHAKVAQTQMIPAPMRCSTRGSGPTPIGKSIATMKKKPSTISISAIERIPSRRSRFSPQPKPAITPSSTPAISFRPVAGL